MSGDLLRLLFLLPACFWVWANSPVRIHATEYVITEEVTVGKAVSDFRVGFCLLTHHQHQYVGYYNEHRELTVASRELGNTTWQKVTLPSKVGFDSHNYITMAIDSAGHLHVAGNMHVDPLVYFRTRQSPQRVPDITSLEARAMTGEEENRCTYPVFLKDNEQKLIFAYRSGSSGNGKRIFNRYDAATQTWTRLLDQPLLDGEGNCNAYPIGPIVGPHGHFHMIWVWRDTPDCATNHHLSYARSPDLKHWTNVRGENLSLPITLSDRSTWIDPVPAGKGIINSCLRLAFDRQGEPFVIYHKRNTQNAMQIYLARVGQQSDWQIEALTDWDDPIEFGGMGSMPWIGITVSQPVLVSNLCLIRYRHRTAGSGQIVLSGETLQPTSTSVEEPYSYPHQINQISQPFKGLQVNRRIENGGDLSGSHYLLRWESLGSNHDRPHPPPHPEPSELKVFRLVPPKPAI